MMQKRTRKRLMEAEAKRRTIIVGDIHGCLTEFEELLEKTEYDKENDRLILCGDLTDRGEFSLEVIRKVREMKIECVKGNHDHKILKWLQNKNTKRPIPDYYHQLNDEDIRYIQRMPSYIKLDDAIIIHGGLKPHIPVEQQSIETLAYLRYTDYSGNFISLKKVLRFGKDACQARFWTEAGSFGTNVIYGHNVYSKEDVRIDRFDDGTACYGIDTGAVFGGRLSCIMWETKEIVQVPAKKEYFAGWY
jgi:bis(5'-nucleosyl)-tetraphosphatase (symmetrical)